ncbi:MAG: helix-turn-helix domain-containing protein [Pseudomonadota bacterium]
MGVHSSNASEARASTLVRSQFFAPPSEFDGCFTSFYHLTLDIDPECPSGSTVIDYLQPEWANIRFFAGAMPAACVEHEKVNGARFVATGASSRPCRFELGSSKMWGIGFLPLGWARFFSDDAFDLANFVGDGAKHAAFAKFDAMSEVLTDPQIPLEQQLAHIIDRMGQFMRPHRDEAKIGRVHSALVDVECTSVADLADRAGMSIRTLERVCRRHFGFTPKLLMRRQRFMRSLSSFMLHQGKRWTEAMDEAYHDQAQFTREFAEFMTMLPSEYAAIEHPILTSFMEARARVWGSAAQTLDRPDRCAECGPT